MALNHIRLRLRAMGRARRLFAKSPLVSPAQFRTLLRRERARADRTGKPFALVTFAARERHTARATFRKIEQILKHRLRCTDEIGWLDAHHIAAVLPGTPAAGAAKVVDDVCLSFPIDWLPPLCEIYCYPLDWLPKEQALRPFGRDRGDSADLALVRTP